MLTLTDDATEAIQELVGDQPGAGLRIFPRSSETSEIQLGLSVTAGPEPTDEVVEQSGAHVFLDRQVAPLVDGHTLDAQAADGEKVKFAFVS